MPLSMNATEPATGTRKVGLPLLSNSSLTTFRRCPREYQFSYVLRRRPRRKTEALRFGTFFHIGLNAWWACGGAVYPDRRLATALAAVGSASAETVDGGLDVFSMVKAEALLAGYTARWGGEGYETIAVETQFKIPLLTRDQDRFGEVWNMKHTCDLGGAIDAIASRNGSTHLVEHKTSSQDISPGSDYWRHVATLDTQVSTYLDAAKTIGHNPRDVLYDVIRKPEMQPLKATPEESRKYTKPTRPDPIPRLYANMRERDEDPAQYSERLITDIAGRPNWYFQRMTVVRLDRDNEAHAKDTADTARMILDCDDRDAWPRSPSSCLRFNRLCEYHDVCSGIASIDDDSRFETNQRKEISK